MRGDTENLHLDSFSEDLQISLPSGYSGAQLTFRTLDHIDRISVSLGICSFAACLSPLYDRPYTFALLSVVGLYDKHASLTILEKSRVRLETEKFLLLLPVVFKSLLNSVETILHTIRISRNMAWFLLSFGLLSLVNNIALALMVTPDSPCMSLCSDGQGSDSIHGSEIVCQNEHFMTTTAGQKLKSCLSCLQLSTAAGNGQNDQHCFICKFYLGSLFGNTLRY